MDQYTYDRYNNKALKYFEQRRFDKALKYFNKLIDVDYSNPILWSLIGICNLNLGDIQEALITCKPIKKPKEPESSRRVVDF